MDKIILLLTLLSAIGSVTKGNAQLQCHVCNNCPNPNELDSNLVQTCGVPDTTTTTTTTIPPEETTIPPEETTIPPEQTTIPPEETTIPPEQTTIPPEQTTIPPEETTDGPIITPTTPNEPPTTTTQVPPDSTTTQTTDGGGITTQPPPSTPPSTTTQAPVSPPTFLGPKFVRLVRQSPSGFQCFVVHRTVGDSVQVNRGCVLNRETEQQTCADANDGEAPAHCQLCDTDGCNDDDSSVSSTYAVSLSIVLCSIVVSFTIR